METALAEKTADFGRFGRSLPAARMARTPRGAGISGKKKGPETFRARVIGGGAEFTTELLAIGPNEHC